MITVDESIPFFLASITYIHVGSQLKRKVFALIRNNIDDDATDMYGMASYNFVVKNIANS